MQTRELTEEAGARNADTNSPASTTRVFPRLNRELQQTATMAKSTGLGEERKKGPSPFERAGRPDPLRSHPAGDSSPRDFTRGDSSPRVSSGHDVVPTQTEGRVGPAGTMSSQGTQEQAEGVLGKAKSLASSLDTFDGFPATDDEVMAASTALSPAPQISYAAWRDHQAREEEQRDTKGEVEVKR